MFGSQFLNSRKIFYFGLAMFWTASLIVLGSSTLGNSQPIPHRELTQVIDPPEGKLRVAQSRRLKVQDIWQQIYQQLPDLPKENSYVAIETGQVAEDDTLIGRLVRYHFYVRGRSPLYRFDWKLTLADYLGVNEVMFEGEYPSQDKFKENPIVGDRAAIESLTLAQRDALVTALADIFNPAPQGNPPRSPGNQPDSGKPSDNPDVILPPQPKPGSAELLLP
ncbi:MAG: hypothetical protein ACRC8A_19870 [Microcoleaceae cyanobacterium]